MVLWSNVTHLILQKPWFGWGWGELDYAHYITHYPGARFCDLLDNAHNLPLHLAVELGIPAALLACVAICGFVMWRQPWRETDPCRSTAWMVLTLIMMHSMVEYPLWYGPFQLTAIYCLVWLAQSRQVEQPVAGWPLGMGAIRVGLAASVFAVACYGWWDYQRVSQLFRPHEQRAETYRQDTLQKVRDSRLFRDEVRFAELTTTPLTPANAQYMSALARQLLHYSPEPRVIELLIESLQLQGCDDEALTHMTRYEAAFVQQYRVWRGKRVDVPGGGD